MDVLLEVHDSRLRVLDPQTPAARLWLEVRAPSACWLGGGLLCTPAEAAVLVPALETAGFTVGPGGAGDAPPTWRPTPPVIDSPGDQV